MKCVFQHTFHVTVIPPFFQQEESAFCPCLHHLCFPSLVKEMECALYPNMVLLTPSVQSHDLPATKDRGGTFINNQPLWVMFCLGCKYPLSSVAENLLDNKAMNPFVRFVASSSNVPLPTVLSHRVCTRFPWRVATQHYYHYHLGKYACIYRYHLLSESEIKRTITAYQIWAKSQHRTSLVYSNVHCVDKLELNSGIYSSCPGCLGVRKLLAPPARSGRDAGGIWDNGGGCWECLRSTKTMSSTIWQAWSRKACSHLFRPAWTQQARWSILITHQWLDFKGPVCNIWLNLWFLYWWKFNILATNTIIKV